MRLLPHWVLTDLNPAFYDTESGSVIEQTAKVYAAMNELIKEYNSFVDEINKRITEFENGIIKSETDFKNCIIKAVNNYINSLDIKIDEQNLTISEAIARQDNTISQAVAYMKDNIKATATEVVNAAIIAGTLTLMQTYDETTESLNLIVTGEV